MIWYYKIPKTSGAADIGNLDAYLLDSSRNIMITGQLSGCCFCIVPHGPGLACTHINPQGAPGGAVQLQNDLTSTGTFRNYPGPFLTYGRKNYPGYATVIGVRVGGVWNIYAQKSNDQCTTITGAERIYPNPALL